MTHPPHRPSPSFVVALMVLVIAACCAVGLSHPLRLLAVTFIALQCAVCARVSPAALLKRLAPVLGFAGLGLALVLLAPADADTPTVRLPHWGREVSAQAATFVGTVTLKSALVVVVVTAFAGLLTERDVILGLRGLGVPGKVVDLTYMMLRSVGSLRDEVVRLVRARDSRGRPHGLRAVGVAGAISRVLLIRLARRAETQAFALCARGYAGAIRIADQPRVSAAEVVLLAGLAAALAWVALLA